MSLAGVGQEGRDTAPRMEKKLGWEWSDPPFYASQTPPQYRQSSSGGHGTPSGMAGEEWGGGCDRGREAPQQ